MIKKNWIYGLFIFSVLLFAFTKFKGRVLPHANEVNVSLETFHTSAGWGYDIYTDDSVYIHQEYIPAIEGRKGFADEEDANTIGKLVIAKMKHSKFPVITTFELDSCGIER